MNRASAVVLPLLVGCTLVGTLAATTGIMASLLVGAGFVTVVRRLTRTDQQGGRPGSMTLLISISGLVMLLIYLNRTAPAELPRISRVLGILIVALGFLPFIVWTQRRELPIPLFPAVTGIYVIYFGAPVFLTSTYVALSRPVETSAVLTAQWLALGGLALMEVGYYWAVSRRSSQRTARQWSLRPNNEPETMWLGIGAVGVLTYLATSSFTVPAGLGQPVTLLTTMATLAAIELYVRWRSGRLSGQALIFLVAILIPGRVILGFGKGANLEALSMLIALGIAFATLRRRIPWPAVAVAVIALAILQPIKVAFRDTTTYRTETSSTSRVLGYASAARDYAAGEGEFDGARESFVVRYGFLTTLAVVMTDSPDHVPYWGGKTYAPLLSKIFPRVLLPWKAEEVTGQAFGHRYHLIHRYDNRTSYNMPIVVEFYANFGPVGVLLGMFGMGLFYAWAQLFALRKVEAVLGTGAAIFVLAQLAYIESALSFVMSGFVYAVVLVYAVRFVAKVLRSRRPGPVATRTPVRTPS